MTIKTSKKDSKITKKNQITKSSNLDSVFIEKDVQNNSAINSSVITKSRNPKVVIQSEQIQDNKTVCNCYFCTHKFVISLYLIAMGLVLLATFFISLRICYSIYTNHGGYTVASTVTDS